MPTTTQTEDPHSPAPPIPLTTQPWHNAALVLIAVVTLTVAWAGLRRGMTRA